jgi:hypothetical protein
MAAETLQDITDLFLFQRLQDIKLTDKEPPGVKIKYLKSFLWFISTGRNAFILMGCAIITYVLKNTHEKVPFALVGKCENLVSTSHDFLLQQGPKKIGPTTILPHYRYSFAIL